MKIINARIHGIIDYLVVVFLWIAPTLFNLPETTALFTYALGFIHLALTLCTNFKLGFINLIPMKVHGWIELIVAMALVPIALLLGDEEGDLSKHFYLGFSGAVFIVWLITDYKSANQGEQVVE